MSLRKEPAEKFWTYVNKGEHCWEWVGGKSSGGYGNMMIGRRNVRAHRFSWEIANGKPPDGMLVLHRCDNKACVRPSHLFIGTHADNVADKVGKRRQATGEKIGSAKLTIPDVAAARKMYASGTMSHSQIAAALGVTRENIGMVVRRKTWAHVQ